MLIMMSQLLANMTVLSQVVVMYVVCNDCATEQLFNAAVPVDVMSCGSVCCVQ